MDKEQQNNKTEEQSLQDFDWDNTMEFFGQKTEVEEGAVLSDAEKEFVTTSSKEKEEKIEKEEVKTEKETKEEKEEKEEEENKEDKNLSDTSEEEFFADDSTQSQEKNENTDTDEPDELFTNLATGLKESGVFSFVDAPEGAITEEEFIALHEKEIEERINDTFEGFFEEMDDDGKAFLKFKKNGGNTADFLATIKETNSYPSGDIEDEAYQRKVTKYYLKNIEGNDDEEIDEKIEWLEERGKLASAGERYDKKLKILKKDKEKALLDAQNELAEKADKARVEFKKSISDKINEVDEFKNIPVNPKDKKELVDFITKPSVKVGKNKHISGMQKALADISKNPEDLIALAALLKSDFDLSFIGTKQKTKQTRNLKDTLNRTKQTLKPKGSGSGNKKSLAEFFED